LTEHVKRSYQSDPQARDVPLTLDPPWRNCPELPTADEINPSDDFNNEFFTGTNTKTSLPENNVESAWGDKTAYIGAHYELNREDGIAPLRRAVADFKENPEMYDSRDVCVYTHVSHNPIDIHRMIHCSKD
jgi:helicase required for RNAi-mediated heterochromatin assembly 1